MRANVRSVANGKFGVTGIAIAIAGFVVAAIAAPHSQAATRKTNATKVKPKPVATTAAPATTVGARGRLVVGEATEFTGLDPAAVTTQFTTVAVSAIYERLMDLPNDRAPVPLLASALTEAPDRRSWTLTIRDGVRFHDGTLLTADAVKLNLDRQRKSRLNGQPMALIRSIDVTGPLSLTLSLDKPYGSLPYFLGSAAGIMISPKAFQEKADRVNREPTDAGTGPYVLKEWVVGDYTLFVRNATYWGNPKPRLEQITFRKIPDEGARYTALRAGDIHVDATGFATIAAQARKGGFTVVDPPFTGSGITHLNNAKPPFDDVRIRRAVTMGVDRRAVSAVLEDPDVEKISNSLWPVGDRWFLPGGEDLEYNRSAARELVSAYVKDTGRDASFTYTVSNFGGTSLDAARLTVRYWQDAGMDVKLQVVPDTAQLILAVSSGQFQAAGWAVGLERDPDATAYPVLFSTSPRNFARYNSPEMDGALESGRAASDPTTRKTAYGEVQRIFRRDAPFIVNTMITIYFVSDKRVCGLDNSGGFTARTVGLGNC